MLNIKITKLYEPSFIPTFAYPTDTGADLYAAEAVKILPGDWAAIGTGLSMEFPDGFGAEVRSRSGLSLKHGVSVLNSPGTIDNSYRGDVKVILINHGKETYQVKVGDRIAQMVIEKVNTFRFQKCSEVMNDTDRAANGFGSSGT
jgi:dUTP pyrophosphatase